FFLVFTAQKLANIPGVGEIVEKFSRWIMAVIYIALGLFIIIENDTIQTILGFIF
ncbi:cadmium resistance transporter, partial [Staphylococcus epidermidis]|nr:cadmium resistance transporter CadD [Staphylococcus epidermidis]